MIICQYKVADSLKLERPLTTQCSVRQVSIKFSCCLFNKSKFVFVRKIVEQEPQKWHRGKAVRRSIFKQVVKMF